MHVYRSIGVEDEMSERGWEMINIMGEVEAHFQLTEGGGEVIDWSIKTVSKREVSE